MKILLVEDDTVFAEQLSIELRSQNYIVEAVAEASLVTDYVSSAEYDLLILDINLPDSDGILLCQKLRQTHYTGALLLLTANDEHTLKVRGLDAGADDYVVKTCSLEELLARIRALLRRPKAITETVLRHGKLQLDSRTCQIFYAQREILLSPKEYSLLEQFLRYPQQVFSSHVLLERLWSFEETPGEETVRTHIKRLRRKLKQAGVGPIIENVYGMGYRLIAAPEADSEPTLEAAKDFRPDVSPSATRVSPPVATSAARQTDARKAALSALDKFRSPLLQRLAVLDQFLVALANGDRSDQESARQAAHKLVGSLGMFGLVDGSQFSRQLETLLQASAPPELATLRDLMSQLHQSLDPLLANAPHKTGESSAPPAATSTSAVHLSDLPTLLVISNDESWRSALGAIAPMPVQSLSITDPAHDMTRWNGQTSLVLLDMTAFPADQPWLADLQELANLYPSLPIIVLVEPDTLQVRLEVARCVKDCICLPRTTPPQQLVDRIIAWQQHRSTMPLHVLAVDDDPMLLATVQQQLIAAGIQVTVLENPHQFWDVLCQTSPDLLLLDYEMPDINGIELCQIIRADPQWQHLPVVFLSGQANSEIIQATYCAGADDFIAKTATESELIVRIMNRVSLQRRLFL